MDLSSLFLKCALSWGFGKVLDAVVKCFSCGNRSEQRIGNVQNNYIYCKNCHKETTQFTNACDFTINKRSLEIGQGIVTPSGKKWYWENRGGWFEKDEWLYIPHFYHSPFYCYAYSFGNLLVLSLYQQFKKEGNDFIPKYLSILSSGGSRKTEELLQENEIDITKESFWQKGFDFVSEHIQKLKNIE